MQVYTAYTVKPPTDYFVYTPSMPSQNTRSNNKRQSILTKVEQKTAQPLTKRHPKARQL